MSAEAKVGNGWQVNQEEFDAVESGQPFTLQGRGLWPLEVKPGDIHDLSLQGSEAVLQVRIIEVLPLPRTEGQVANAFVDLVVQKVS